MSVTLTGEAAAKIQKRVDRGEYTSADAVVDEALRLLEEHEKLQWLRAAIAKGMAEEAVPYTEEMRAEVLPRALRRAAAGELPKPGVLPPDAGQ